MAIEIVQGGNIAFNAMMFGAPDPRMQEYLANQFSDNRLQGLTDTGRQLFQQSRQMFERFSGDTAIRYIKALSRASNAIWQTDTIRPLTDIGQLQWAPPTMQRWIMADPVVRKMYHEQRVDGFSHHYVDYDPSSIGHGHYDYRRAMQGLVVMDETDDPDTPEWSARTYFDDLAEGDVELTLAEKLDIQTTWDFMRHHLRRGKEDPTSRFNASLE